MLSALLTLHHVSKVYGTRIIFRDVSLTVAPASICLLLGPNGAGKSTLMNIMAGLGRATEGRVVCTVADARLGYLGHATFLYPSLTALENLAFWRDLYNLPRDAAFLESTLERVGLARFACEQAGVFSRGMAQRLNLARVLLLEPELLLLDEPATGLDTVSAALLRREILAARERGAGIVWISHDATGDVPLADQVFALEGGKLAYSGPASGYGAASC